MRNSLRLTPRFIVLAFASTALLAGCGGGIGGCNEAEQVQYGGPTVIGSDSESLSADEGPQYQTPTMGNLQGLEQKFPKKYPVKRYPNSRVVMCYVRPDLKPGQKNVVLLNSSDAIPTVGYFYKEQMARDGWKLEYVNENSAFTQLMYKKGDQSAEVRITPDPYGKRHVQLLAGPYKPVAVYNKELPPDSNVR
jgi:hypothetical protein